MDPLRTLLGQKEFCFCPYDFSAKGWAHIQTLREDQIKEVGCLSKGFRQEENKETVGVFTTLVIMDILIII